MSPVASIKDLGPLQPDVDHIIELAKKQIKTAQTLHGGGLDAIEAYIDVVREVAESIQALGVKYTSLTNEQKQAIAAESIVDIIDYFAINYAPWYLRWALTLSHSFKMTAARLLVDIVWHSVKGAKKARPA